MRHAISLPRHTNIRSDRAAAQSLITFFYLFLFLFTATSSFAIWAGNGVSLHQGSLDGTIPIGGLNTCSGLLLTNEWVLTVAHCFTPGEPRWITLPDGQRTRIEVDAKNNYRMPDPDGAGTDIRVMKLVRPVRINGLTSHFVTRIHDERTLGNDGIMLELGAGENEFGQHLWHQSCAETSWSSTWPRPRCDHEKEKCRLYMKFEHDQYAGNYPVPDPRNIGCEYSGGDSGSATLHRDEATHEWYAVAVCPGIAEGACQKASIWQNFVMERVWGNKPVAGLSTTTPYRKAGETVKVHYHRGGDSGTTGLVTLDTPGCSAHDMARCGVDGAFADGDSGVVELRLPDDAPPGRYQVRYYWLAETPDSDWQLKRVIGLQVGGGIRLANRFPRIGNDFEVEVHGLDGETTAFLAVVPHGSEVRGSQMIDFAFLNGTKELLSRPSSPVSEAKVLFFLDRYFSHFGEKTYREDTKYDVVLLRDSAQRTEEDGKVLTSEVDRQMFRTRPNIWAPIQSGFNKADGLRLYVDGLDTGELITVTLTQPGKAPVTESLRPKQLGGPAEYFAHPTNPLLAVDPGPATIRIERHYGGRAVIADGSTKIEEMTASLDGSMLDVAYTAADWFGAREFSVWDGLPGAIKLEGQTCELISGRCVVRLSLKALPAGSYVVRAVDRGPRGDGKRDFHPSLLTGILKFDWPGLCRP